MMTVADNHQRAILTACLHIEALIASFKAGSLASSPDCISERFDREGTDMMDTES
jgi:hypothetical protein